MNKDLAPATNDKTIHIKDEYKYTKYEMVSLIILIIGISLLVWILGYLLGKRVIQTEVSKYKNESKIIEPFDGYKTESKQLNFQDIQKIKEELDHLKSIYAATHMTESIKKNEIKKETTHSDFDKQFVIQVSAFKKETQADILVNYLRKKGFNAYKQINNTRSDPWFRVRVGIYKTREEAARASILLKKQERLTTFITQ